MGRILKSRRSTTTCRFFKVMIGDFHNKLLLPKAFVIKNMKDNVPKNFVLRSSTRRSWRVSVKRIEDDLFLCNEWRIFVQDHGLECGEFLVFRYYGNSEFSVKIFRRDGCVKELPLSKKKNTETRKVTSRPNTKPVVFKRSAALDVVNSFTANFRPHHERRMIVPKQLAIDKGLTEKDSTVLLDPIGRSWPVNIYHRQDGRTILGAGLSKFCRSNRLKTNDTCCFRFVEDVGNNAIRVDIFRTSVTSSRSYDEKYVAKSVAIAQRKERAVDATAAFTSDNPFCSVTLHPSYVDRKLVVLPSAFAKKFLKYAPREVTLRVSNGDTWHAQYSAGFHHVIQRGWSAFALDNDLKENDVCIFELIDQKHITMKVSIIRHTNIPS